MTLWVAPKLLQQDEVIGRQREVGNAFGPELLEIRQPHVLCDRRRAHAAIDPATPGHLVATFRERFLITAARSEIAEDIEIVAGLPNWRDRAMHRENEWVARRSTNIVAFQRRR